MLIQISDAILNKALAGKYNVLWETTGTSNAPMQEISRINGYNYETIVVYPVVKLQQLLERASLRAENEGQEAAPASWIKTSVEKAQRNLLGLLPSNADVDRDFRRPCPTTKPPALDPQSCRAQRVIIIDNTGLKGQEKIAFDSKNPANYCAALSALHQKVTIDKDLIKFLGFLAPLCPVLE